MSKLTHRLPHQPWSKPSRNEQEYFVREEFNKRMGAARQREAARASEERNRWLDEHRDHCPKCGGRLEEVRTIEGVADQCPNCLGVWMSHEVFDRITHPHEKNEYLTGIFRDVLLQYTTGKARLDRP